MMGGIEQSKTRDSEVKRDEVDMKNKRRKRIVGRGPFYKKGIESGEMVYP